MRMASIERIKSGLQQSAEIARTIQDVTRRITAKIDRQTQRDVAALGGQPFMPFTEEDMRW